MLRRSIERKHLYFIGVTGVFLTTIFVLTFSVLKGVILFTIGVPMTPNQITGTIFIVFTSLVIPALRWNLPGENYKTRLIIYWVHYFIALECAILWVLINGGCDITQYLQFIKDPAALAVIFLPPIAILLYSENYNRFMLFSQVEREAFKK